MDSYFAPAERAGSAALKKSFVQLQDSPLIREILDSMPYLVLVINSQRQAVFANHELLAALNLHELSDWLGRRPGELFDCVNVKAAPGGCGTGKPCRYCGAVHAILDAGITGEKTSNECRITTRSKDGEKALDLRVTVKPVDISSGSEADRFLLVSIQDISDVKRREVLERTFFHDVLNRVSALRSSVQLLEEDLHDGRIEPDSREYFEIIRHSATAIQNEIVRQRELIALENGTRELQLEEVNTLPLLGQLVKQVIQLNPESGIPVTIEAAAADGCSFITDPVLLQRVLFNMLKNGLEADRDNCPENGKVTVTSGFEPEYVWFAVHNCTVMPEDVQAQIFQRSFSTKGRGRGIGTWSIKLISEHYLHGKISFESRPGTGTVFRLELPHTIQ